MRPATIHAVPRDDAVFEWVFMSAFIRDLPVDTGVSVSVSRLVTYNTNFSKNFKQEGKFARQTVSDCAILVATHETG